MKFKLSRKSGSDLADIWRYTNEMWGPKQADTYLDTLCGRFLWLTGNPSLWCQRDDIREGLYSYHESRHIIFFRRYDKGIEIVRILHERMDMQRHL